jgi:hypothetical protein
MRMDADRSFKRDDLSRFGRPMFQGAWSIKSDHHLSSDDIGEHVAYIVSFIRRHRKKILSVKKTMRANVRVRIFWDFDNTLSFSIDRRALQTFTDVLDDVGFSIV